MIWFCCGIIVFIFCPVNTGQYWWAFLGFSLVLCACSFYRRLPKFALPMLLGFTYSAVYAHWGNAHLLPQALERAPLVVVGSIDSIPQNSGGRCRFLFSVKDVFSKEHEDLRHVYSKQPRKLQLNWYQCPDGVKAGQQWQFDVRLKQPRSLANYGGYDFERAWFSQSIDGRGYVKNGQLLQDSPSYSLNRFRAKVIEKLGSADINPVALPLLKAILLGDKSALDDVHWLTLRQTGTVHLLIVSGLHIGLVSGFVLLLFSMLFSLLPLLSLQKRRLVAVTVAIFCAVIYAFLAGFTLPTQRALIMTTLVLVSWLLASRFCVSHRLAIAMALVLLLDPLSPLSAGFWLSFGAAGMLLYMINSGHNRGDQSSRSNRLRSGLINGTRLQLGMFLFSLPLLAYWFYQVPLMSAVFNIIAVPVVGFLLLPLSLIGMSLWGIFEIHWLLAYVAEIWAYGWSILRTQAEIIGFQWDIPKPSIFAIVLALLGTLWLLAPKAVPAKMLGAVLWLPLVFTAKEEMLPSEFDVKVFDVGQGLSILIQTKNKRLLYDTAASYGDGFAVASISVLPALKRDGVLQLNKLVISHGDNDHSGGSRLIKRDLDIHQIVGDYPNAAPCLSGQQWVWDEVTFEFLHPDIGERNKVNNRSCVLKVSSVNGSILLTGDIEAVVEEKLLREQIEKLSADVLIVPHHGSKTSSTPLFVEAVNPRVAINSAGYLNRYNHPHPDIINAYEQASIVFVNTATSGQIDVYFRIGKTLEVAEFRQKNQAYWRR